MLCLMCLNMVTSKTSYWFSTHALERGLERIFEYEAPYSVEQIDKMREFLTKNVVWNQFTNSFVLDDYNIELVIINHAVVTLIVVESDNRHYKPVGEFLKTKNKTAIRLGRTRNGKNRYKRKSHD